MVDDLVEEVAGVIEEDLLFGRDSKQVARAAIRAMLQAIWDPSDDAYKVGMRILKHHYERGSCADAGLVYQAMIDQIIRDSA